VPEREKRLWNEWNVKKKKIKKLKKKGELACCSREWYGHGSPGGKGVPRQFFTGRECRMRPRQDHFSLRATALGERGPCIAPAALTEVAHASAEESPPDIGMVSIIMRSQARTRLGRVEPLSRAAHKPRLRTLLSYFAEHEATPWLPALLRWSPPPISMGTRATAPLV